VTETTDSKEEATKGIKNPIQASTDNQSVADDSDSSSDEYTFKPPVQERARVGAMEVLVDGPIDKAMKVLKRKLIKEGLFKELKARRYYEKPSERRKRKLKESMKKIRKEESRRRKNQVLF